MLLFAASSSEDETHKELDDIFDELVALSRGNTTLILAIINHICNPKKVRKGLDWFLDDTDFFYKRLHQDNEDNG